LTHFSKKNRDKITGEEINVIIDISTIYSWEKSQLGGGVTLPATHPFYNLLPCKYLKRQSQEMVQAFAELFWGMVMGRRWFQHLSGAPVI